MFVYDFQNIAKIKNLKNNQYVEPKHAQSIEEIPNTILAEFDYTQYKMLPPNSNESMKTIQELINLSQIPADDEFTLKMDKIKKSFRELSEQVGVEFPKQKVTELKDASGAIILDLKYHFNRPRPYKLAREFGIPIETNEIEDTTFDSPSYPSGHATQATLIGNYLANKYPLHRGKFLKLGRDIARSRVIAKVHYPSDVRLGETIGNDMFRYLKEKGLI